MCYVDVCEGETEGSRNYVLCLCGRKGWVNSCVMPSHHLSLACPLQMSSAKEPLAGHPQLLKCLEQIEEERMFNELLASGELVWRLCIHT